MTSAAASPLAGRSILIVEDEYLIADDLARELRAVGAGVVGPVASLSQAMRLLVDAGPLDVAILDINLRETLVYPLIDQLLAAQVRVLITSGYDAAIIPDRYRTLPRCDKPVSTEQLREAAERLWDGATVSLPTP
ncbi:response regulator [Sphingomonas sp. M6A6_1c]